MKRPAGVATPRQEAGLARRWVEERPPAFDFATSKSRNRQEPISSATEGAFNQQMPRKLPRYTSELKIGIFKQLMNNRRASNIEICRGLDEDGVAPQSEAAKKDRDP